MCWMKGIEEMEENDNRWGRQQNKDRTNGNSLEKKSRLIHITINLYEQLHICPSY